MDTPENQNLESTPKKPNYTARRIGAGLALAGIVGVGVAGSEAIKNAVEEHSHASQTPEDTVDFTIQPGESVSEDALKAAKRLVLDGKPIDPAAIPTSDIITSSQFAEGFSESLRKEKYVQPGEPYRLTLYEDGHAGVDPLWDPDDPQDNGDK